jgi:hypothetical protein
LIDAEALGHMKSSAYLVNVARGRVVDEAALIEALAARRIAGAGLDVTAEEPLAPSSPLWGMEHVLVTPHTAGETRHYEDNVIEILRDNLDRLWRGESQLRNQVVLSGSEARPPCWVDRSAERLINSGEGGHENTGPDLDHGSAAGVGRERRGAGAASRRELFRHQRRRRPGRRSGRAGRR